jgi:hypothetical protein
MKMIEWGLYLLLAIVNGAEYLFCGYQLKHLVFWGVFIILVKLCSIEQNLSSEIKKEVKWKEN